MNAMNNGMWSCLDNVCHEECMLLENLAANIRARRVVIEEPFRRHRFISQ
jgi:hypothetical protein